MADQSKVPSDLVISPDDVDKLPKLSREQRIAKVWDFKVKGVSVPTIAHAFGVSEKTIYEDLKAIGAAYRDELLQTDGVALLAENLRWLDEMERIALFEVNQSESVVVQQIDPVSGQITNVRTADPNRGRFFQAATKIREMKLRLMMETGVLPRNKAELFEKLAELQKGDVVGTVEERTPEEIHASIEMLMKHGRFMRSAEVKSAAFEDKRVKAFPQKGADVEAGSE